MSHICPTCKNEINNEYSHNPFAGCWYAEHVNDEWNGQDYEVGDFVYLETQALGPAHYRKVYVLHVTKNYLFVPVCYCAIYLYSRESGELVGSRFADMHPCIKTPKRRRGVALRLAYKPLARRALKKLLKEWKKELKDE